MKVSSRTYEEEMRRRNESEPVQVIDCSKLQESASKPIESVNKSIDQSAKSSIEEREYVPKYVRFCIISALIKKYVFLYLSHVFLVE